MVLDPASARRLVKLCGMLGSAHDGERASAAALANKLIRSSGLTWSDVIRAPSIVPPRRLGWRITARECLLRASVLAQRERDFLADILRRNRPLTPRQAHWLNDIHASIMGSAP
jgi:hypothetical protein